MHLLKSTVAPYETGGHYSHVRLTSLGDLSFALNAL